MAAMSDPPCVQAKATHRRTRNRRRRRLRLGGYG
jgi:hypothetical protein